MPVALPATEVSGALPGGSDDDWSPSSTSGEAVHRFTRRDRSTYDSRGSPRDTLLRRCPPTPHQSRLLIGGCLDSSRSGWWRRRNSNPRPVDYEPTELPNCSTPLGACRDDQRVRWPCRARSVSAGSQGSARLSGRRARRGHVPHGCPDTASALPGRVSHGRQDSNLQPPVLETGALPVELRP